MLLAARERTLLLAEDLRGDRLLGPRLAVVNPPLWELGHVGWFQEYWCLRQRRGAASTASRIDDADALYDSARVPHRTRWDLPLPDLNATLVYLARTLVRVIERLDPARASAQLASFAHV